MADDGRYEVIVVGAGHSGSEAGLAAARMGCRTLVVTLNLDAIAMMPCNPSLGGPGKGHLLREIDALGGEMARNGDRTCLQMRRLNTGKGPAVQALRGQIDKAGYSRSMKAVLEAQDNLDLRQGMVTELLQRDGRIRAVAAADGRRFVGRTVVLTTGVYMKGQVVTGDTRLASGPKGEEPSRGLSDDLRRLGLELGRFKTGTPPRLAGEGIDYAQMRAVRGDDEELAFSFMSEPVSPAERRELPCWQTATTEVTHEIIRDNLHLAPLYNGSIQGKGPRYCPSVEDKVVRFGDRDGHRVVIEPEGRDTDEMYVLGLSTSLPEGVQQQMVRSVPGLEDAVMTQAGYAIEYDYVKPTQLRPTLETKAVPGLYTAGQINGSSGYEEAACQGLMAGINASLAAQGREALVLDRSQAYIAVLIDDLVTKGTREPYRMFTSRAEYRLLLREGNADLRLTDIGREIGLVSDDRWETYRRRRSGIEAERRRLEQVRLTPTQKVRERMEAMGTSPLRQPATLAELLRRPELDYESTAPLDPERQPVADTVRQEVEVQLKYAGYIEKQQEQIERFRRREQEPIPEDIDYDAIRGLSTEGRERLKEIEPESLGRAMRVAGVTPADVSLLMVHVEADDRAPAAAGM